MLKNLGEFLFRSMNNIFRVQVEYLHSLNVSITEAIVKMSHVRFNGNIYFPPATKQDSAYDIFSFTHHVLNGTNRLVRLKLKLLFGMKLFQRKLTYLTLYLNFNLERGSHDLVNYIEFAMIMI